ncbi:MAG: VPLPA-CTERM sorting domain-containing protein [Arenibacterium sp.]
MKKLLKTAALICAVSAGGAQAAPIKITYQPDGLFGVNNLRETVKITTPGPGYDGYVRAGMFHLSADQGIGDFLAFCVDLAQFVKNPQYAVINNALFAGATLENMERLFSSVLGGGTLSDVIDTSVEAAGLQVALWEVMLDTGNGYDLDNGAFSMSENAGVEAQAEAYLSGLFNGKTGAYKLTFFESDKNQDVVTVAPVPLPASALMILAGLGGLITLRRRKSA